MKAQFPWLIFYSHRIPYCSNINYVEECRRGWEIFADLIHVLEKYKVDLYLGAHVHYYERMGPIT